jgi:phosphoribosylaminoimidazolecarboxamide formyltransferase/IMP cyclohydrolase
VSAPGPWPRTALFSLSDKTGVAEFARALAARGTRLIASGGTARHLAEAGLEVTPVESLTGFPEMLGGRVKTLHPHVHGPILARRGEQSDLAVLAERGLDPIDLVAVTLYPFEERAAQLDDPGAFEEIDIGGVALLRAAAKNHSDVIVIHSPSQYAEVREALEGPGVTLEQRRRWAAGTFARTARYDAAIASELAARIGDHATGNARSEPPAAYVIALERVRGLRYGENPHQSAALYVRAGAQAGLEAAREGKELSYNNLVDASAAVALVGAFTDPACVIVKHNEPCGAATGRTQTESYQAALAADEQSAFGGVVAFNTSLEAETAQVLAAQFVEVVAAPGFHAAAAEGLKQKKNLRLVQLAAESLQTADPWSVRLLGPWALLQSEGAGGAPEWRVVTKRAPTPGELESMQFAWTVVSHAASNAIVLAQGTRMIGMGSGQTSRVDAVDLALTKAKRGNHDVKGAALASDGFFPFADNVEHAAEAGVTAIVQPGGSVRDEEVIAACDRHGIAMCFTSRRVFRH